MSVIFEADPSETRIVFDQKLKLDPMSVYRIVRDIPKKGGDYVYEYERDLDSKLITIWRDPKKWVITIDISELTPDKWHFKVVVQCIPGDIEGEDVAGKIVFEILEFAEGPDDAYNWVEDYFDPHTIRKRKSNSSVNTPETDKTDPSKKEKKIDIPKRPKDRERWHSTYEAIKALLHTDKTQKQLLVYLKEHHIDEWEQCKNRGTLAKIIIWGEAGEP